MIRFVTLALLLLGLARCSDPQCRPNEVKVGMTCQTIRHVDGGTNTDFAEISDSDFPYLRHIAGALKGNAASSQLTRLSSAHLSAIDFGISLFEFPKLATINLSALKSLGTTTGSASLVGSGPALVDAQFPQLVTVSGDVLFTMLGLLQTLNLASLERVGGQLNLNFLPNVTSLAVPKLMKVGGSLQLMGLVRVPYSRVSRLNDPTLAASLKISDIGCCTPNYTGDVYMCSGNFPCGN